MTSATRPALRSAGTADPAPPGISNEASRAKDPKVARPVTGLWDRARWFSRLTPLHSPGSFIGDFEYRTGNRRRQPRFGALRHQIAAAWCVHATATRFRARPLPSYRDDEAIEDGQRVQRPGCAFRMVLNGFDGQLAVPESLDRAIVEVHLADIET